MNIVVTGASSGIGFQTVKELALNGEHHIIVIARNKEKLELLKTEVEKLTKSTISIIDIDLSKDDLSDLFVKLDHYLKLSNGNVVDILINNAGYLVNKSFIDLDMNDWKNTFDVNLFGAVKFFKMLFRYFNRD